MHASNGWWRNVKCGYELRCREWHRAGDVHRRHGPGIHRGSGFFLSGGTLQGQARSNSQVLWSFAGDGHLSSAPIVVNDYVFIGASSGTLYALDAGTGAQVWTQNLGAAIPPSTNEFNATVYTGLSAGDGLLVVPNGTRVTAYVLSTSP